MDLEERGPRRPELRASGSSTDGMGAKGSELEVVLRRPRRVPERSAGGHECRLPFPASDPNVSKPTEYLPDIGPNPVDIGRILAKHGPLWTGVCDTGFGHIWGEVD